MTISRHNCLGGGIQPGDAPDCPICWTCLVASVDLSMPGAPEPYEVEIIPVGPETSPEVLPQETPCRCSSCDPRTCSYCFRQDHRCAFCKNKPPVSHACPACGFIDCRGQCQDGHA